ncbi:MAG: hypothetical protein IT436_02605 [Phycisphaerales bacterium]|nr:hypothetical protein [Phycisphaerales bacterium]
MKSSRSIVALIIALPGLAAASITGVTGGIAQIAAPPLVMQGFAIAGANPQLAAAWDERQGISVTGLPVDMINNPGSSSAPIAGPVSGIVDSHYLYFRHLASPVSGTVSFSGPIVGLAFSAGTLYPSDPVFIPTGTTYSGGIPRGLSPGIDVVSINSNILTFSLFGDLSYFDTAEVRVLTRHIPAPAAAILPMFAGLSVVRRRRA